MRNSLSFSVVLHLLVLLPLFLNGKEESKTSLTAPAQSIELENKKVKSEGHIVPKNSTQAQNKCLHSFGGIGVVMSITREGILVNKVIEGYPAEAAGLQVNDVIIAPAVGTIKGTPGTNVSLMIQRDGGIFQINITRGVICTEDVGE